MNNFKMKKFAIFFLLITLPLINASFVYGTSQVSAASLNDLEKSIEDNSKSGCTNCTLENLDSLLGGITLSTTSGQSLPSTKPSLALLLRAAYPDQTKLVDLYKPYLTDNDYVITFLGAKNLNYAQLLPGSKTVTYASLPDIQNNIMQLKGKVSYIAYDIEKELSPAEELADPVGSVRSASKIAHDNGIKFMLAPSGILTEKYGPDFAPFVDVYVMQYQAYQKEPSLYKSKVINMANKLKTANPSIELITQVSTLRGSISNMEETFSSVSDHVDGVTIFYGMQDEHIETVREFLEFAKKLRSEFSESAEIKIPDWVRNNAGWWSERKISDKDFASGIQYLIKIGVIKVPLTESDQANESITIPDWVRNNAGWWSERKISDMDFASGIQYLIKIGIILV